MQKSTTKLIHRQCEQFLTLLPRVEFAMVYGSMAFPQKNAQENERKQIDLILGTSDPVQWHEENLKRHPEHYSFMKYLGSKPIAKVQEWGPGLYYHPYIEAGNKLFKYGVVSVDTLLKDLNSWDSLYSSARMMNPHSVICETDSIRIARIGNFEAAFRLALLLLPHDQEFDVLDLYYNICSLGFQGDIKWISENPNKIKNIVEQNEPFYETNYKKFLNEYAVNRDEMKWKRQARLSDDKLILQLPNLFLDRNKKFVGSNKAMDKSLKQTLRSIVRGNSIKQTAKGFVTAGPLKSLLYVSDKLSKKHRQTGKHKGERAYDD